MSHSTRRWFFIVAGAGLLALYLYGLRGLPAVGHYRGPYGDVINAVTVYERHATDAVTAVNFDYRGFDTLGEEFILFTSVLGVALLLRVHQDEQESEAGEEEEAPERRVPPPSDAVRVLTLALIGPLVIFGIYIVTHGQLTPGGGFQGGVILATAPLLIYLAGDVKTFQRVVKHDLVEISEAFGAAGFALTGFAGILFGSRFLENVVPLGKTGEVTSAGTIPLISVTTGLEVTGGFALLLYIFLQDVLQKQPRGGKP